MNYYELLNVKRDAQNIEIKRAYFSAVKLHSPDADPEGFKAIRTAYETLCDQKRRAEYDSYFVASGDLQNDLLTARNLIREGRYRQAEEFMEEIIGKNSDSADAKRLLAELLYYMHKTSPAGKICKKLLEIDPHDGDTLLLLAKITVSRGHTQKASDVFNKAVIASPKNPKVWTEYMHYALEHNKTLIHDIFRRAMKQNMDMFHDDYILYLTGVHKLKYHKNQLRYYDKFAQYYINDKNPEKYIYENLLAFISTYLYNEELIPFVMKVLPVLENSRQRDDEDDEKFEMIHSVIEICKIRNDKRIHDVLVDLTISLFYVDEDDDEDRNERLSMECYIVFNMSSIRPSIKVLKNEYPESFKLNQAFYFEVLNEKKIDYLLDKYSALHKKLKPVHKDDDQYTFNYDEDECDEEDEIMPFVRNSPKTGRNDPCPCGSGKKYKKCCG